MLETGPIMLRSLLFLTYARTNFWLLDFDNFGHFG